MDSEGRLAVALLTGYLPTLFVDFFFYNNFFLSRNFSNFKECNIIRCSLVLELAPLR